MGDPTCTFRELLKQKHVVIYTYRRRACFEVRMYLFLRNYNAFSICSDLPFFSCLQIFLPVRPRKCQWAKGQYNVSWTYETIKRKCNYLEGETRRNGALQTEGK